ncbi:MAG: substrate-binding domain-containing protein [Kiritimatiellae bacterium]|jgi:DNA-binding LacI/PurR family transcriptional regulator|nr:substrate-binding domain-containing protein [Kiritimatiellia bacterium]
MIDKESKLKYMQVEASVRDLINRLEPGDRLPTERELAKMLGCHVLTVRKGIQPLVDEGYLNRRVGSGTFVNPTTNRKQGAGNGPSLEYIGLLITNAKNLYSDRLVQSLADTALKSGGTLRSAWVNDFGEDAIRTANDMVKSGCKALILPWHPPEMIHQVRAFTANCPVPVVLPELIPGLEQFCFESPEVFGASSVLEVETICHYFLQLGCGRIHFIGPEDSSAPLLQKKITAYAGFASRNNLDAKFGLFNRSQSSLVSLAKQEAQFKGDLAIISYDDAHAARFMSAMHILGLEAPRDYRIIGHNDTSIALNTVPPLTTIRENFGYISESMIKSANALCKGSYFQSTDVTKPTLVVRESCGGREQVSTMKLPKCELVFK